MDDNGDDVNIWGYISNIIPFSTQQLEIRYIVTTRALSHVQESGKERQHRVR